MNLFDKITNINKSVKDDQKSLMAFFHVYDFEVIMLNHRVPWNGGDGGISRLNVELLEHFILMDHICPSMIQDGHVNQNFFFIMAYLPLSNHLRSFESKPRRNKNSALKLLR